jgi:hypothetical protein
MFRLFNQTGHFRGNSLEGCGITARKRLKIGKIARLAGGIHWKIHTIFLASLPLPRPKTSRRHIAHLPCAITRTGIPTPAPRFGSTLSRRRMSFFPTRKRGLNITTALTIASSSTPRMRRKVCGVHYSAVAESNFRAMTVHLPEDKIL